MLKQTTLRDGVARCARYAFGPNRLHLCGPDANKEVFAYLKEGVTDLGLQSILKGFATMFPYLQEIARANRITDPFDDRVVEAYWIGNKLLETIEPKTFFEHLAFGLRLKDRYDRKEFGQLAAKLPKGARMHHSFHVFNAYKRTGHDTRLHTLESMDACRISWGKVTALNGPKIEMQRKPLLLSGHHLALGEAIHFTLMRRLEEDGTFDDLIPGQWVTMHWGMPCEIISNESVKWLEHYTQKHIRLANLTL